VEQEKWLGLLAKLRELLALAHQVDFVSYANEFASAGCFQVGFCYVFAFVVEKTVRVPGPGDASHVDTRKW